MQSMHYAKHWLDQNVLYNFHSELTETGRRCFNLYVML